MLMSDAATYSQFCHYSLLQYINVLTNTKIPDYLSVPFKTYPVHLRHDGQQLSLFCLTEALLTAQCLEPLL